MAPIHLMVTRPEDQYQKIHNNRHIIYIYINITSILQGDQKVSVNLMITVQKLSVFE
jgi:hypothetical protein